ncbi:MAG: hypothetical protein ACR2OL_01930, partial [Anderseniella sp.]
MEHLYPVDFLENYQEQNIVSGLQLRCCRQCQNEKTAATNTEMACANTGDATAVLLRDPLRSSGPPQALQHARCEGMAAQSVSAARLRFFENCVLFVTVVP